MWIDAIDRPILDACKARPGHKKKDRYSVYGKVALANRMYGARLGWFTKVEDPEWAVAKRLASDRVDSLVRGLAALGELNERTVSAVVAAHARLVSLIHSVAKREYLSFSSKYLSFHWPRLVPIFDSGSALWSKRIVAELQQEGPVVGDTEYAMHCGRIITLRNYLRDKKNGVRNPDIKLIDYVLYWMMEGEEQTGGA
ncbi:MAG TPA: hypothetical protein VFA18_06250 [Gemmataceae bacterium]|nr:hypothetical protein [Gemmataceae bacterium]